MKRTGMGLVGPGFVEMHHVDAVRRLGFVDVVAVADDNEALARAKADALGVRNAYGSYEDPSVMTAAVLDSHRRGGVWTKVEAVEMVGGPR